ncbi:hypothetical protein [Aureimonas glaciei]|uniref:Uncharacterized protein n=1 Tax=Aureimonas glaciei TaxID=1776957 RepID=A0A916XYS1_9HYPH|nr:hypothetical protein [Aureimonas glaciei]GGD20229.1 hypothetical protein GCM10011335_23920 [Aureimonas glaciei]
MAKTMKLTLATSFALLLLSSAASAAMACGSAEEGLVFSEVVTVDGSEGAFRLICREGRLTAIPVGTDGAAASIDGGGPPVSVEGTTPQPVAPAENAGTTDAEPGNASDPHDTGLYAAGVAGQSPAATMTQSAAEAPTSPSTLPPLDQRGDEAADKPGVSAEAAAAGREGATKSEERIAAEAPEAAADAPSPAASPEMVRVPAAIAGAARSVLPGITFKNVVLSRDGASTIYGLAGENQAGRGVAVDVDQAGAVRQVDRQIGLTEVPPEILKLAQAVLPEATIDKAVMSIRPNFQSFFVLSGRDARAEDFALDIRTDGRSLAFIDPR